MEKMISILIKLYFFVELLRHVALNQYIFLLFFINRISMKYHQLILSDGAMCLKYNENRNLNKMYPKFCDIWKPFFFPNITPKKDRFWN